MTYLTEQFLQEFECAYLHNGTLKHPVSNWVYRHYIAVLRASINGHCLCESLRPIPRIEEDHNFPHASLMLDFIDNIRNTMPLCESCSS